MFTSQGTTISSRSMSLESPALPLLLKQLKLDAAIRSGATLEDLYQSIAPLRLFLPELEHYAGDPCEGKAWRFRSQAAQREFPRMVGAFVNFGIFLRACEGLSLWDGEQNKSEERAQLGRAIMARELELFSQAQQQTEKRLNLEEHFIPLVRLFQPIAHNPELIETVAVALACSDVCKMPHIKQVLQERIVGADTSDHEVALEQVFRPEYRECVRDIFPSFDTLPSQHQRLIIGEIEHGANIGNLLQMEVGAAALSGVRQLAQQGVEGVRVWMLSSILDISSARARSSEPATWVGSELITPPLAQDLVAFSESVMNISLYNEVVVLDSFWNLVAKRPFYRQHFEDESVSLVDKEHMFRLARYLSLETDYSPRSEVLQVLSDVWRGLSQKQQETIGCYLQRSGCNPHEPRPTATYMIYMFSQLYAKHFDFRDALTMCLPSISNLLEVIEEHALELPLEQRKGMPLFSGEALWPELRRIPQERLIAGPLRFAVVESPGMVPRIELAEPL